MRGRWIFLAPLALVAMVLFVAVGTVAVLLLWNWLLPPLFGWHEITFWQALGVLALCRILFGSFGMPGAVGSGIRRRMAERMESLTPEERERMRQRMRERWGFGGSGAESHER